MCVCVRERKKVGGREAGRVCACERETACVTQ